MDRREAWPRAGRATESRREAQPGEAGRHRHHEPGHGEDGRRVKEDPERDGEHREQEDERASQAAGAERDAGDAHGRNGQVSKTQLNQ